MASGWTNKGKYRISDMGWGNGTEPTVLYLVLITSATTPTADHNTLSQFTEIAAGNGYTSGGISLTRNGTNFPSVENDTDDRADIDIPDQVWTASGGPIPASGNGARWALLTDDNVTQSAREVYAWFDLGSDRSISDGQTLTLQNMYLRIT